MSEQTATERMRAMLDERGVEYETEDRPTIRYTDWGDWLFTEPLDAKPHTLGAQCELMRVPVTPEQAIAATLGRGTCHDVWDTELMGRLRFQCSECGGVSLEITPRFCPNCGRKVVDE
jgi:hypothetical protein